MQNFVPSLCFFTFPIFRVCHRRRRRAVVAHPAVGARGVEGGDLGDGADLDQVGEVGRGVASREVMRVENGKHTDGRVRCLQTYFYEGRSANNFADVIS